MGIGWEIIGFIFVVGRRMGRPGMMAVDGLCVSVCWPEVGDYIVTKIMERFGEEAEQGSETRLGLLLVRCAEEDKPRMQSECRRKSQGKMEMGGEEEARYTVTVGRALTEESPDPEHCLSVESPARPLVCSSSSTCACSPPVPFFLSSTCLLPGCSLPPHAASSATTSTKPPRTTSIAALPTTLQPCP